MPIVPSCGHEPAGCWARAWGLPRSSVPGRRGSPGLEASTVSSGHRSGVRAGFLLAGRRLQEALGQRGPFSSEGRGRVGTRPLSGLSLTLGGPSWVLHERPVISCRTRGCGGADHFCSARFTVAVGQTQLILPAGQGYRVWAQLRDGVPDPLRCAVRCVG